MYPILFHVGQTPIYTYSLLLDLGLVAALAWAFWHGRRRWGTAAGGWVLDGFLATCIGGLLCGRAVYVAVNWSYYRENAIEILALWRGGLSFVGALVGGVLALAAFWMARRKALANPPPFWAVADLAAEALALGGVFGWLACLSSGAAYGAVGYHPLAALLPDAYGVQAVRFATQPIGALVSLAVFLLLLTLDRHGGRPGLRFATYLLVYCGASALLEWTRGEATPYLVGLRAGQIAFASLAGMGLLLLLWRARTSTGRIDRAEEDSESLSSSSVGSLPQ